MLQASAHASHDTIVAVSSPPGRSLRGLVRISGNDARRIVQQLIDPRDSDWPARALSRARIMKPPIPALLGWFPGPNSYTGQDLIELQLPGHPALLERVIEQAIDAGARPAEAGEFTFRGFLAGRFDLTQAEGIAATISARSESQLQAARLLRQGQLGSFASELVDALATQLALVEAGIDFVDQEDVVPIAPSALDQQLEAIQQRLDALRKRSRSWGALEALPRVVLAGPPSAGKSTLFNALLGMQRAVIDPSAGTTRDVLSEPITVTAPSGRAVELMLMDLAGLDEPAAALDRQVQQRARQAIEQADLVVWVCDRARWDQPLDVTLPATVPRLRVLSKADDAAASEPDPPADVALSAVTGRGLDALRHAIAQQVGSQGVSVSGQMLALQGRHEQALNQASAQLHEARELLTWQRDQRELHQMELIAGTMRGALDELAGLGGRMSPDELIGRVFATFCVGK